MLIRPSRLLTVFLIPSFLAIFVLPAFGQVQLGADIDGEAELDQSGYSVSLSKDGMRLAVGAINNDGNGENSGHTRVFEWNGAAWVQLGLDIDGESAGDVSGASVSLSANGSRVAIGAFNNDGSSGPFSGAGHTRVYQWTGAAWTQLGGDIDGSAALAGAGLSVSLSDSGSRLAMSSHFANGNAGESRAFEWSGAAWVQMGSDIAGEAATDFSGNQLALSGDGGTLAVGAPLNDGGGDASGHVRVFNWNGADWQQLGSDIDGEAAGDLSGFAVSLSNDGMRVAIGASENDGAASTAGHVRVFDWGGATWDQVGSDIDGTASFEQFGSAVSLSSDGNRVAIGGEGSFSFRGLARVYQLNGGNWEQVDGDMIGEAIVDRFGDSISLSGDGTRVAVGAKFNDGSANNAGMARVYEMTPPPEPEPLDALPVPALGTYAFFLMILALLIPVAFRALGKP